MIASIQAFNDHRIFPPVPAPARGAAHVEEPDLLHRAHDGACIPGYRRIGQACQRHGCKVFAQLSHPGREMTLAAAARVRQAGLDGIEIVASHGDLIARFFTPRVIRREDAHGGSHENRLRFARDVLAAVRAGAGPVCDLEVCQQDLHLETHTIGDALCPRPVEEAVLEGLRIGAHI